MAKNRGKQFEQVVRSSFEKVSDVSIDRLPDQTTKYKGSTNICDFIVYQEPYEYYIECKSTHGNTFPFTAIRPNQWDGLLEKSKIKGVFAGVICWWVDKDITAFIPIQFLQEARANHFVSLPSDYADKWILDNYSCVPIIINGRKKRVLFDYDMEDLLRRIPHEV